MKVSAYTDVGKHRKTNQDSYYVSPDSKYFLLADGMGGHNGGETASSNTVEFMRKRLDEMTTITAKDTIEYIKESIAYANRFIFEMSHTQSELSGMGTTLIVCCTCGGDFIIANIGDSRVYKISDAAIVQVTKDHSLVQEMVDSGTITPEMAEHHPHRNMITRAVGTENDVEVDFYTITPKKGEYIVLCSDGLTNMVSEQDIQQQVLHNGNASDLIDLANENGGLDNITAIVIKV